MPTVRFSTWNQESTNFSPEKQITILKLLIWPEPNPFKSFTKSLLDTWKTSWHKMIQIPEAAWNSWRVFYQSFGSRMTTPKTFSRSPSRNIHAHVITTVKLMSLTNMQVISQTLYKWQMFWHCILPLIQLSNIETWHYLNYVMNSSNLRQAMNLLRAKSTNLQSRWLDTSLYLVVRKINLRRVRNILQDGIITVEQIMLNYHRWELRFI